MQQNLIAHASLTIDAPVARVWDALVNPATIQKYMFGTTVETSWKEGSPITFKGEWQGKAYKDNGIVLRFEPKRMLQYSHFSPGTGLPEIPENFHTVTIELAEEGKRTRVTLAQDNNATEEARAHSQENWEMMLGGLKKLLEK